MDFGGGTSSRKLTPQKVVAGGVSRGGQEEARGEADAVPGARDQSPQC